MRYVLARLEEVEGAWAYRYYVTDSLQNIPRNKYTTKRFYDIIHPKPIDNKSGDEIAAEVIRAAGLTFGG